MFEHNISKAYDFRDATWEIVIMLAVSFILGYLLRKYLDDKEDVSIIDVLRTHSRAQKTQTASLAQNATPSVIVLPEKINPDVQSVFGKAIAQDDLKIVEGIGPKIEVLLKNNGITSWALLASAPLGTLERILEGAGDRFKMHNPRSWSEQAALARDGKWQELKEYQDFLVGGR